MSSRSSQSTGSMPRSGKNAVILLGRDRRLLKGYTRWRSTGKLPIEFFPYPVQRKLRFSPPLGLTRRVGGRFHNYGPLVTVSAHHSIPAVASLSDIGDVQINRAGISLGKFNISRRDDRKVNVNKANVG